MLDSSLAVTPLRASLNPVHDGSTPSGDPNSGVLTDWELVTGIVNVCLTCLGR